MMLHLSVVVVLALVYNLNKVKKMGSDLYYLSNEIFNYI